MNIIRQRMTVISNDCLQPGVFSMWLKNRAITELAKPGQFIDFYLKDPSRLLPRPISICEIDGENDRVRIVFRVAGAGTDEIAHLDPGDTIEAVGPLGNGYKPQNDGAALLVGGGIGIPPLLELAKQLKCKKTVVLGYRDENTFLADEFRQYADVLIATEDGSVGTKGFVTDCIEQNDIEANALYSCGPLPMLKSVAKLAEQAGIPAYVSLEERMACGIGACLGCVVKTKDKDAHTNVNNARICKEGPVFNAKDIDW